MFPLFKSFKYGKKALFIFTGISSCDVPFTFQSELALLNISPCLFSIDCLPILFLDVLKKIDLICALEAVELFASMRLQV